LLFILKHLLKTFLIIFQSSTIPTGQLIDLSCDRVTITTSDDNNQRKMSTSSCSSAVTAEVLKQHQTTSSTAPVSTFYVSPVCLLLCVCVCVKTLTSIMIVFQQGSLNDHSFRMPDEHDNDNDGILLCL
jgi:hypothetical protein